MPQGQGTKPVPGHYHSPMTIKDHRKEQIQSASKSLCLRSPAPPPPGPLWRKLPAVRTQKRNVSALCVWSSAFLNLLKELSIASTHAPPTYHLSQVESGLPLGS